MAVFGLIGGRYEIKEPLGEGGMGVVYRAIDIKTKSFVALKTMKDVSNSIAVELFSKEWSVLASLSHPNIVDIRDVGEIEEGGQKKPFFVMPLLEGATLAQLIEASSARLSVERVVEIVGQVCRGLQAAHERNLVHRDIKPSNIFVMDDNTAKIIDFGVVHLAGAHSETGQKGTWQYMSPEQIDMKPASPASDIFSLGVVCYEALTGRKPFARKTLAETADAVRSYIPPSVGEINGSASQLVAMVVHKAMAKQALHRFSSARDFGDTLQKAYLNQPIPRFDLSKIRSRIERAKKAFEEGDIDFTSEILTELETEGHLDSEIRLLHQRVEQASRQRKIRQLIEAARTRVDQGEIPLAMEKLHEALEIDPENTDADAMLSALSKQLNEQQIDSWMQLARHHVEQRDFGSAKQSLDEVLKIRPSDPAAAELFREIDRLEKEADRVRGEKEKLYDSAMKAYDNGDVSTALNKLERLLDLGSKHQEAALPDRDAVYQSFYNEVRTQRDSIRDGYEQAKRYLAEKHFVEALGICNDFVAKYPNDPIFQALKIEVEEQQRQELALYMAEVARRADAETDLDRKVGIYKEACDRYPNEQQFRHSLKLTRERRDLVLNIVTKARFYEDKKLFTEALDQWDILRNIYPRYPGLETEKEQVRKRKEQQHKDDSKSRLINQIDGLLDSGDFERARQLAADGLTEYPLDQELVGLERLARQGLERSFEAKELSEAAEALCAKGQITEACEQLRRALELEPKSQATRDRLVRILVDQARSMMPTDWHAAEPIVQQLVEFDPAHPDVRGLHAEIADREQTEIVNQCRSEARDLQAAGDLTAALDKIDRALGQYPGERRLKEFRKKLENSIREARGTEEKKSDARKLHELKAQAKAAATVQDLRPIVEQSQVIQRRYPDDREVGSLAAQTQHAANERAAVLGSDASVFMPPTEEIDLERLRRSSVRPTRLAFPSQITRGLSRSVRALEPGATRTWVAMKQPVVAGRGISRLVAVGGAVFFVALAAGAYRYWSHRHSSPPLKDPGPAGVEVPVRLQTTPADAIVTVKEAGADGTVSPDGDHQYSLISTKTYDVMVSKLGYVSANETGKRPEQNWIFALSPRPIHVSIATDEKTGTVFIDDERKNDLENGSADVEFSQYDGKEHKLSLRNGAREIFSFNFMPQAAGRAAVSGFRAPDLLVVSSFNGGAAVFSGSRTLTADPNQQGARPIPAEGLPFDLTSTNNVITIADTSGVREYPKLLIDTSDTPTIYVGKNANTNWASIQVEVKPETSQARLFVDNRPQTKWVLGLTPGVHTILVKADGYEDHEEPPRNFVKGINPAVIIRLKKKEAPPAPLPRLVIAQGTPGAEVLIDSVLTKTLDGSGSAEIDVSLGTHTIKLQKQNYEPVELSRNFTADIFLGPKDVAMKEWGTLRFQVTPPDAVVSYRRIPANDLPGRSNGQGTVRVPEGTWAVHAEAPGYLPEDQNVTVSWAGVLPVPLTLIKFKLPPPPKLWSLEDPSLVTKEPDWTIGKAEDGYIFFNRGDHPLRLRIPDPGKGAFNRQKHVNWVVAYTSSRDQIEYDFDYGKELTQKVTIKGKRQESKIACPAHDGPVEFSILVQASQVTVTSPGCTGKFPSFSTLELDFVNGKVGIKTRQYFSFTP